MVFFFLGSIWFNLIRFVLLQTYVLDVHPFNPRIAMSAGYDGRTIVWDVSHQLPLSHFSVGLSVYFK